MIWQVLGFCQILKLVIFGVHLSTEQLESDIPGLFPACAVTRSIAKKVSSDSLNDKNDLVDSFGFKLGSCSR